MSMHDTTQDDLSEEDTRAVSQTEPATLPSDEGELDFKISVRKVQMKVQARGVLAE